MLVLSRKIGEKLVIGDDITIVVNRISGNRVTLGIEAPEHVRILRGELPAAREFTPEKSENGKDTSITTFDVDPPSSLMPPSIR